MCFYPFPFGLVLLEYFLLEKRCLLSIPHILSYLGKKLIGISPLEPGLDRCAVRCRYDAMYIPGYRYVPLRSAALRR